MKDYIKDEKISLNKYSNGYLCLDYAGAISHAYAIRRKSREGAYWWHGFNDRQEMINFISRNISDGNETHEVICNNTDVRKRLLFFDIDGSVEMFRQNNLEFKDFIKYLNVKVRRITGVADLWPKILECHRGEKYSAHLIYDVAVLSSHAKCIPFHIIDGLRKLLIDMGYDGDLTKSIDKGVYRSISSMRVMGSPKYTDGEYIPPFTLKNSESVFDPSTLVMIRDGEHRNYICDTASCYILQQGNKENKPVITDSAGMDDICGKIAAKYPQFSILGVKGNIIKIKDDHTKECIICKRSHVNENPYAVINKDKSVSLICRRDESKRAVIIEPAISPPKTRRKHKKVLLANMISRMKLVRLLSKVNINTKRQFIGSIKNDMELYKHIALSSALGSGKTKALFDFIMAYCGYKTIISVIHRRSLTANMRPLYKQAGFVIYDEIDGEIDLKKYKRVLIQYESLHRLNLSSAAIDLLIGDEINSVCMQYLSKIAAHNRRMSECVLESLFKSAKSSIMLDGNLCDRIVNAINCLGSREYHIWENMSETLLSPNIILALEDGEFNAEIIKKLKSGSKIELVTARGPNYCETMAKFISDSVLGLNILTIHSETEERDLYTSNVEEEWIKYDCIIRSPAVGAGIDFTAKHFDYCFVDVVSGGPLADDLVQAMRRSRHIKTNTYYVHFGKCKVTKYPTTYNGVLKQAENAISHNLADSMKPDFDGVIRDGRFKFRNPEAPLFKFDIWCRAHKNKQQNNIMKRMMEALGRMDAKFSYLEDLNEEESKKMAAKISNISDELKSINFAEIAKSEEITNDKFAECVGKNRLSKEERSSVNKYILRAKYSYAGEMDLEWVKKYSDKKVLAMNKHIASRDVNINELAAASELLLINTTDTDRMIKHKTDFMYNVARTKIRDIYDKYNRTAEFSVKMVEYINREIEINNPIYGGVKLKNSNTKYVLLAVNDVLMNLGYEIRIKSIYTKVDRSKNIYEFEWFDIASDYYNLPNKNEKNNKKPDFPNFRYLQLT